MKLRETPHILSETLAPSGLMGPRHLILTVQDFDFSEFSLSTFGGFPHLGDFEGYDRKNRGADLLVHQFLMNSLIYITRIHHQYQKLCCEGNPKVYRGYEQYSQNLLQQTTSGEMIVSSCGFDSALID